MFAAADWRRSSASQSQRSRCEHMSTEETVAEEIANPFEDGIPFSTKLAELAEQRRDDPAVTVVALDGTAISLTFGELDARANQWGRALAASGAGTGSLVALAIPNS